MRKLLVILTLLVLATGCATSTGGSMGPPINVSSPVAQAAIAIARVVARGALTATLQQRGVPPQATAAILVTIDPIIDKLLSGQKVTLMLDPSIRQAAIDRASKAITDNAKVGGVPVVDKASADLLASQLYDAIAAAVQVNVPATGGN